VILVCHDDAALP